ncbi:Ribosomal protein L16 Arg81 hydroxylase, contains JmjC domain [Rhodococcus triatomae]|uniref:Ribosomal protein L16 Arg81 hydroxylase, contains JmjC domain n=1 Tax=Rhodococcus triatomae TaxID=300028 RepID=A0A1G8DDQ6_9NOCA|nr:cupin domain-containing protein [Rhodococcus triatomae]SDH55847.1 Ribosomal protein L16 Arg81 hydroxylase, contains JmjC domain [Rhodococcus triatomae]
MAVGRAEFAERHWDRAPVLSRAADLPRDYLDLLSPDAIDELIAERGVRTPFLRMARDGTVLDRGCFTRSGGFGAEMPDQIDSAGVFTEFSAGATIVLQGLHRLWPPIIDFVRALVDDIGHPVQANAYVTPPSSRGFDPHYDTHDVFVLQVAGTKEWVVHPPVQELPLPGQPWTAHRSGVAAAARVEPFLSATLEPGDALYLPRGWIHSARARGETSVHLTIGVAPTTRHDVVRILADALGEDVELRRALPLGTDHTDATAVAGEIARTIELVGRRLGHPPEEPSLVESVAAAVGDRFVALTRPAPVRPLATLEAIAAFDAGTTVRWRSALHGTVTTSSDAVSLALPDRTITLPPECASAVETIAGGGRVCARDLPGLSVEDGVVVLRRLLREGVVVPTG